jgi:hypothetical protein
VKQVDKDKQMDLMQKNRNQSQAERTLKGKNKIKDETRAWEDDRL